MYSLLISIGIALVVAIGGSYAGLWGWIGGPFVGLLVFVIAWILITRRLAKRLRPTMERVQKQVEARMLGPAIASLEELLPLGPWIPMLEGQIHAQIGVLAGYTKDEAKALEHLRKASKRAGEAQLALASMLYRKDDVDGALRVLDAAAPYNKKSAMFFNVAAWMLHKQDRTDEAMQRLAKFLAKNENEPATKDNMLRLQNGRKMTMQPFGMPWYALQLERPPMDRQPQGQFQQHVGRKGFRKPNKKRG